MRFPMLSSGDVPENGTVQKDFYNKTSRTEVHHKERKDSENKNSVWYNEAIQHQTELFCS